MKRSQGNPLELVLPTRVSPDQFSEVDDLLVEIGSPIGVPDRKTSFTLGEGEGSSSAPVELSPEQYNRLLTIYGKETVGIDEPVSGGIDQDQAIKKLQANQIDYWVLSREQLGRIEKPSLPIAFENKEFVVYKVSENKGSLSDSLKVD